MFNLSTGMSYCPQEATGKVGSLNLNGRWLAFQKKFFFYNLIKIISGETEVAPNWRKAITNAAILGGQSQISQNIPLCFLWNIIALETLLTHRNDKYSKKLPERVEAFLGWASAWEINNLKEKIQEIYKKRSQFVHLGRKDLINIEDILFSDELLLNVFTNIVGHTDIFGSKRKLIEFSKKIQAEKTLEINGNVRPKSFRLIGSNYKDEDFEGI